MPPSKRTHEDTTLTLKEKLHSLQGTNPRGRRNGAANLTNGSHLKEVMSSTADNASTNSGQNDHQPSSGMSWSKQDDSLLKGYRRAYRLNTPSAFKNPLSHIVLGNGIGRHSPTMARPKAKRRVHKDQLALAVRKNFNALGVNETDVIVDLLYKVKTQGKRSSGQAIVTAADSATDKEFRVRFAPQRK